MIGFLEIPTGRMGNVLIQYVFMRQLAERIGTDYFHVKLPYCNCFENFGRRHMSIKLLMSKKWRVNINYIENIGVNAFIEEARVRNIKGYTIVLEPPLLGHLFEFIEDNPARFLEVKKKWKRSIENQENKVLIGLHFRGTDFKEWNPTASLPAKYYKDSIDMILKIFRNDSHMLRWFMFTDDNSFSTYCDTASYLKNKKLDYIAGNANTPVMFDFYQLSQCDYIISSPSTYAIMATIMGKDDKKIIQNRNWVEYCVQKGEIFWEKMKHNEVPWYHVIALL